MNKRVCATALLAALVAACGGDGNITEPHAKVPGRLTALAAIGMDPTTGATIETNLDDYAPGGVVTLTGRGWAANETVHLVMTEDPDRHEDVVKDVQADGSGGFTLRFYDVQESDIGVRFTLTGTGTTSGSKVTVQFTDNRNLTAIVLSPASPFAPGTSVNVEVEVVLNSGAGATEWLGTKWEIRTPANVLVASSPAPCLNTPDHKVGDSDASGNKHSESFSFIAPAAGTYNLTVSVYSTDNCAVPSDATSMTVPFTVSASNTAPVVSAGDDATIDEGATFAQDGSFTDPDANSWTATVNYGDGSGDQTLTLNGKNFSLSHVYADNGTFTVTVTVNDGTTSASDQVTVTVNNVAPTATFNAPASVAGGTSFTISLTDPMDPSTADVAAGFTYAFDCGSGYGAFSGTSSVTCPGVPPTSVTVKGKIRDKDGGEREYTKDIAVDNIAPIASAGGPYSGNEGSSIALSGSGSDPDGGSVTYEWSTNAPVGTCTIAAPTAQNTSVTCSDNGAWSVSLKVTDDEQASTTSTVALTVENVAPTINTKTAGGTVDEGSSIAFAVSNVTDPSTADVTAGFQYAFACDGVNFGSYGASSTVNCPAGDGPGSVTIAAKAKDKDGGESAVVSSTFTVENVAPTVDAGSPTASLDEGSTFSRSGSFTDPGPDTWNATVDYGDGTGPQPLALTLPAKTFNLSHTYANDGVFTVTVTVADDDGGSHSDEITVTVNNVLPTVNAGSGGTIDEGGTFTGSGSFTDPGADMWTATVDYGDGSGPQPLTLNGKNFSLSHTYADDSNGPFTITVKVNDDDGFGTGTATVTVLNVAPTITNVNVPLGPVAAGQNNVTVSWMFTDPGADTWTCEISWNTGLPFEAATYSPTKNCSATKTLPAGIYTVTVKVTDDDGAADTETSTAYIVVYDPGAGFVTGGGWIMSPRGAYVADESLEGKATFGFVSKYQKGQTKPSGDTEFQFHAAKLNFKSRDYDWLVISGTTKAQFKGTGTINGSGNYGFMLSAIDGDNFGNKKPDTFRIKIWDIGTGQTVYDNNITSDELADPSTVLGGGSIQIKSK